MSETVKDKKKGINVRKQFKINVNIKDLSNFVKCNPKGVYYIENNIFNSKSIRYLMYLRKNGLNVNDLIDFLNNNDENNL